MKTVYVSSHTGIGINPGIAGALVGLSFSWWTVKDDLIRLRSLQKLLSYTGLGMASGFALQYVVRSGMMFKKIVASEY